MVQEHSQQNFSHAEIDDLEVMLCDAYEVPEMPRSLLVRLDRQIENDWGASPGLVSAGWGKASRDLTRRVTRNRVFPAIAMVASVLAVISIFFNAGSSSSLWAEMIEALQAQGVTRMQIPGGTRWMSMSDQIVIEEGRQASVLWDLEQNLVLTRQSGGTILESRTLNRVPTISDRDRTVLSFLLGPSVLENSAGLKLTGERSESIQTDRGAATALVLSLSDTEGENWEVRLTLDDQTHLPELCEVVRDRKTLESLTLTYPETTFLALQQQHFPRDLTSAHVAGQPQPLAIAENTDTNRTNSTKDPIVSTDEAVKTPRRTEVVNWQSPDAIPSQWDAVEVREYSSEKLVTHIDSLLEILWQKNGIEPTVPAGETELLRRVYLDLAGRTPTVHEVRSYVNDSSPDRYERLVDQLLSSPDHASHLATVWRKVLIPEGIDLTRFGGVEEFDKWLAAEFAAGKPYDEIVSSLLLAEGRLSNSGPLLFYTALKLDPDQIASRTARIFLGMRLECATCHDHPFEPWKQTDFWGYAAFFAQISRPRGKLEQASRVMRVADIDHGEVMLPDSEQVISPQFLDGTSLDAYGDDLSRREQFVRWLTDPANPYFARATANRVWGQLFGKGITDPVDNFGVQHKPKIPELIDLLAGHLIASDFQLSELLRAIVHSKAYRLSSGAENVDPQRLEWFAQMQVKMLTAEQIYDCIAVATLLDSGGAQDPNNFNLARFSNPAREAFLQQFSTPAGSMTDYQAGIPQALTLMNGSLIAGATGISSSGLLKSLEAPFFNNRERVEVLYMATLSRPPQPSEWEVLEQYLPLETGGAELRDGLADLLWVLLNSAEFTMNH